MSFVIAGNSASTGYNLTRSLRFRASASAYLSRTITTNGTSTTWTYSTWVKRGTLGAAQNGFLEARVDGNNNVEIRFNSSDAFYVVAFNSGSPVLELSTTQVFRDPSAWYHIIVAVDTTQATAANRAKIYVNGTQVTALSTATYPAQNTTTYMSQTTATHNIGRWPSPTQYFDGYLAEVNFIDGQALTPSSFGSTNATTGVWQPARYTGTYGTNGFYLPFTDNSALTTSSNVGLGKDFSGNGNYWTTNNISITAGVTYDSMTDVPTLTSATAANFAVLNPLDKSSAVTLTNGNLAYSVTSGSQCRASFGSPTSGLIYFEHKITSTVAPTTPFTIGGSTNTKEITDTNNETLALIFYTDTTLWQLFKKVSGVITTINVTGTSYPVINDIVQIAYDSTNGKVWMGKNNSWIDSSGGITGNPSTATNPTFTFTAGQSFFPALFNVGAAYSGVLICGQQPFTYTPPTGFVALNTYNLPTSTIVKGNTVMDATLYTGAGNTLSSITNAAGFKPDFVWSKARSVGYNNYVYDSVRGTGTSKSLVTSLTDAEGTNSSNANLSSFNSNGWTIGTTSGTNALNDSGQTFVGWQWQAGQGSSSSNTNGTITSTVSVNASAGFSVVTFSTPSVYSNATVGHGLGVTPSMFIVKNRNGAANINWNVYHQSLGNTQAIYLNLTNAATTSSTFWNNTSPTSSVFTVGANLYNSSDMVAYCWTPIAGYSAFGSYTGNGSATGPFVYTGFQPKFILIKSTTAARDWILWDTVRNTFNIGTAGVLFPNTSGVEYSGGGAYAVAVTSNGFYLPVSTTNLNASGETHIYAAFATVPFKNSLAF